MLVVATSKPTVFSEQILKYFNIDQYFDHVVGSNLMEHEHQKLNYSIHI
nr:hypothetical protein [Bacillus sp. SA1-12]